MIDIIHRIGIKAPLEKVHDAITTADGLKRWWTADVTGESTSGGTILVQFRDPAGAEIGSMAFSLQSSGPGGEVRWRFSDGPEEWIGTEATFRLSRVGDMTIVLFGHRNWREAAEFTSHCSMKWATFLLSLRDLLETGQGRPAPDDVKIDDWN